MLFGLLVVCTSHCKDGFPGETNGRQVRLLAMLFFYVVAGAGPPMFCKGLILKFFIFKQIKYSPEYSPKNVQYVFFWYLIPSHSTYQKHRCQVRSHLNNKRIGHTLTNLRIS